MPADVAFDTLAEAERLARDGVAEADAKAITAHSARILGSLATKDDLGHAVELLKADLRWIKTIGAGIVAILVGAFGFGFSMLLGMTGDIATLQADISTVQTAVAAQGADIATIQSDLAAIKDAVQALAGDG